MKEKGSTADAPPPHPKKKKKLGLFRRWERRAKAKR